MQEKLVFSVFKSLVIVWMTRWKKKEKEKKLACITPFSLVWPFDFATDDHRLPLHASSWELFLVQLHYAKWWVHHWFGEHWIEGFVASDLLDVYNCILIVLFMNKSYAEKVNVPLHYTAIWSLSWLTWINLIYTRYNALSARSPRLT